MATGTADSRIARVSDELAAEMYAQIPAESLGLALAQFRAALERAVAKYVHATAGDSEIAAFCRGLRQQELALTAACAEGSGAAWDIFIARYRPTLYAAALSIAKEESKARELADSIYAELYGMRTLEGKRVSKLLFYTGRGSLEGWLRTVVAQEFIDQYRKRKRLVSLEEESESGRQFAAPERAIPDSFASLGASQLTAATDQALEELSSEEKFLLSSYFLDQRTLAEIGRTLGTHESTVSRKLEKIAKNLRKKILANLVRAGMSRRQAEEALDVDVRDFTVNVRAALQNDSPNLQTQAQACSPESFHVIEEKQP